MKKLYYNFSKMKKECPPSFIPYLDRVRNVISPYQRLDAEAFECTVIEHFDGCLFVAYPTWALKNVTFLTFYYNANKDSWTGTMHLGIDGTYPRNFSLQNNVLYICKSTYVED